MESPSDDGSVEAGREFEIRANVTMLCGCPTEPGGLWNADNIETVAVIKRGAHILATLPLTYAGQQNIYTTMATVDQPGGIEIQVLAMDPGKANFGRAIRAVDVVRQ